MAEADVASLLVVVARGGDANAEFPAFLLEQRGRELGERAVLPGEVLAFHGAPDVDRRARRFVGEDARGPRLLPAHATQGPAGRGARAHAGGPPTPGAHGPRAISTPR